MDTKEKVIKKAWGVVWFLFNKQEKEAVIKNNGYYKGSNDDIFEAIDQNEHLFDFIAEKGSIPYSLEGIDDNNGWITLKGEPNEIINDDAIWIINQKGDMELFETDDFLPIGYATHYQPIIKPKLPLHK
jgi:hypothetical protein